jgi:putative ABC transport system substrate-binding protein
MATGTAPDAAPANVAGVIDLPPGLSAKRLALLHEAVAEAACLAVLLDEANSSSPRAIEESHQATLALGIVLKDYWVKGPDRFSEMFAAIKKDGAGGVALGPGAMFFARRSELAGLASGYRLPSMSVRKEYAEASGLMSYGSPIRDNYRRAAAHVDKILRGAKPANLLAEAPTEYELVVNLKVASTLGLTVPGGLLRQAIAVG